MYVLYLYAVTVTVCNYLCIRICRHLNWTLKSLKVGYGRDDDQPPLRSFTPELSFPQSNLELLLEGEREREKERAQNQC